MPTGGDSIHPQGVQRPKENLLVDEYPTSKPLNIPGRVLHINLPPEVLPTNAYGIFFLFFGDGILDVIRRIPTNTRVFERLI